MWIVREIGRGLAAVSLAMFLVALAPPRGWASEGGGGIEYYYSDDEDDDKVETLEATPERSAYLAPTNYDFSFRPRYTFANDWTLRASYSYSVEESTEEPTIFTADYTAPALNFQLGERVRFRWRFPESDVTDSGDDDAPASTPSITEIKDKVWFWGNFETVENLDEEQESGTTGNPGQSLTEAGFLKSLSLNARAHNRIADWLGDKAYQKFRDRFGPTAENTGAEDQSGWDRIMFYCGGTCVGLYY